MHNKTRKSQRGGMNIMKEEGDKKIDFYAVNAIPQTFRNRVKSNRANRNTLLTNYATPRKVSKSTILFPGDVILRYLLVSINETLKKNKQEPLPYNSTVEVSWLRNLTENLGANPKTGSLISKENIISTFNTSLYEGKNAVLNLSKPAKGITKKNHFFVHKGIGERLLRYVLNELATKTFFGNIKPTTVVLIAKNRALIPYYQRFGFEPVEGVKDPIEGGIYGQGDKAGVPMILRLTRS
jgi:hypothetical protein